MLLNEWKKNKKNTATDNSPILASIIGDRSQFLLIYFILWQKIGHSHHIKPKQTMSSFNCDTGLKISILIQFYFLGCRKDRWDPYIGKSIPSYFHRNEPFADRRQLIHNRICTIVLVGWYHARLPDSISGDYDRTICRRSIVRLSRFVAGESRKI